MGLQRNVGFFGLLSAFGISALRNLLYTRPGGPRYNTWFNRLINGRRRSWWSSCWWLFVITARRIRIREAQQRKISIEELE
jgi:hypothetical protein